MLTVSISMRLIYGLYCTRNFEECHFDFVLDRPLLREMLGFSGWNFIGSTAGILSTHGINILINIFFGVALNQHFCDKLHDSHESTNYEKLCSGELQLHEYLDDKRSEILSNLLLAYGCYIFL